MCNSSRWSAVRRLAASPTPRSSLEQPTDVLILRVLADAVLVRLLSIPCCCPGVDREADTAEGEADCRSWPGR